MSNELQQQIYSFPQKYVRFVPSNLLSIVFDNLCKQEIDILLEKEGFKFNWESDESLYYECSYIPVFKHPVTGKFCFCFSTFDSLVTREWYRKISQRYSFTKKLYHHYLPANLYKMLEARHTVAATVVDNSTHQTSTQHMYLVDPEGNDTKMTVAEACELGQVQGDNAVVFKWQQGDILVMDNLQIAHARLNVQHPRKILTAFGNMCSIWDMEPILFS